MIQSLHIQNYALIEKLDLDLQTGFSVITGETGAGKSIILGAIGLLLGQRAESKSIKKGASKCVIEAVFNLSKYHMETFFEEHDLEFERGECILRREVTATGKSRAFVNDTPVALSLLKELGEKLIDVHSQHQNLLLSKENFLINVVDTIAEDQKEKEVFDGSYRTYHKTLKQWKEAVETLRTNREEEDYLRFQLDQLQEANLQEGEQEELEQELDALTHAEDIKQILYNTQHLMEGEEGGFVPQVRECRKLLSSIRSVYPQCEEWTERLESAYLELKDISQEVERGIDRVNFDPERMEWVNDRLNTIYTLEKKHRMQHIADLLELQHSLEERMARMDNSDEEIARLEREKDKAHKEMVEAATLLSAARRQCAERIQTQMKVYLIPLGIPNVNFKVDITPREEPDSSGMDKVSFLFSANKNGVLQPLSSVASGGEIARVMLSLKAMISGTVKLPTIIFDEIDTGVSGKVAEQMAQMMQTMGTQNRQVISITHLPQIAAFGQHHYKVYKEDRENETVSHIIPLEGEARVEELAHMLSGAQLTEAAINNAKELLKQNIKE
jgi:DNA repair protein RecN (Recombination protein N)